MGVELILRKGVTMSRIVRRTSETPLSLESIERLKRLAEMPDSEINTTDIPERRFGQSKKVAVLPQKDAPQPHRKAS